MDKMKEFLLKNKGCPMTPAATKQLLVKFIEWLQQQGVGEVSAEAMAWVNQMKSLIEYDSASDGIAAINGISIPSIDSLYDMEGNSYFSYLMGKAGKVVKVNDDETGFSYESLIPQVDDKFFTNGINLNTFTEDELRALQSCIGIKNEHSNQYFKYFNIHSNGDIEMVYGSYVPSSVDTTTETLILNTCSYYVLRFIKSTGLTNVTVIEY